MDTDITRVILVEDHDLMRLNLGLLVEKIGSCKIVAEANCGEEALAAIRSVPADLVLLNLTLPKLSGLTVLKEIRKSSDIKILMISMHTEPDVVNRAINAGANGFFSKDQGVRVLESAILDTLEGKRPICVDDICEGANE